MASTRETAKRKKWLRGLADKYAYEGAKRVEISELILEKTCVLNAVYVTPDSLEFVEYWYRQTMELTGGSMEIGVRYQVDGRRWSYYRDGCTFRKEPSIKRAAKTVRQIVYEADGVRYVVLAVRPPGATLTQICITVLPGEGPQT